MIIKQSTKSKPSLDNLSFPVHLEKLFNVLSFSNLHIYLYT